MDAVRGLPCAARDLIDVPALIRLLAREPAAAAAHRDGDVTTLMQLEGTSSREEMCGSTLAEAALANHVLRCSKSGPTTGHPILLTKEPRPNDIVDVDGLPEM